MNIEPNRATKDELVTKTRIFASLLEGDRCPNSRPSLSIVVQLLPLFSILDSDFRARREGGGEEERTKNRSEAVVRMRESSRTRVGTGGEEEETRDRPRPILPRSSRPTANHCE